ncbi:MAG: C40 family peptidase [Saprospiraceae bacterium]|nr:C40 family peptidase [Saprospiraceae bacterium]
MNIILILRHTYPGLKGCLALVVCLCISCSAPKVVVGDQKLNENDPWKMRESILSNGMQLLGTPYKRAGKNTDGFDCSGLVQFLFSKTGLSIGPSSRDQINKGTEIDLDAAKPGDLIFFGTKNQVSHVGLICSNKKNELYIIHSTSSKGVIHENILASDYWLRKILRINQFESYLPENLLTQH